MTDFIDQLDPDFWVAFLKSPGFGGFMAFLAALLATTGVVLTLRSTRSHQERERWWSTLEWTYERSRPTDKGDAMPVSGALSILAALAVSAQESRRDQVVTYWRRILRRAPAEAAGRRSARERDLRTRRTAVNSMIDSLRIPVVEPQTVEGAEDGKGAVREDIADGPGARERPPQLSRISATPGLSDRDEADSLQRDLNEMYADHEWTPDLGEIRRSSGQAREARVSQEILGSIEDDLYPGAAGFERRALDALVDQFGAVFTPAIDIATSLDGTARVGGASIGIFLKYTKNSSIGNPTLLHWVDLALKAMSSLEGPSNQPRRSLVDGVAIVTNRRLTIDQKLLVAQRSGGVVRIMALPDRSAAGTLQAEVQLLAQAVRFT